ncbi:hypothetical protein [Bacillus thuringiensis]|uniref:hypothetical protein n=1 Tax=Bacillus thuringiensis TaxID=1428 RepID=UPI000BFDDDF9|nr:hypothetical protein [Bacillus thuringiensis]PGT89811.1 hypothetical protein COD17_08670 [Bacillus thuringiensis]
MKKKRYVKTKLKCRRKVDIAEMKKEFNKAGSEFDSEKIQDMITTFCGKYNERFVGVLDEIAS